MRSRYLCALVALVAPALVASAPAFGQTIYKQSVFPGEGFSSTFDPNAVFAFLAADNFTLGSAQTVGRVRWWGNSDDFGLPNLQNFTQFTLKLHQRLPSGLPGPVIYSEAFATANTNPVDTGLLSTNNTHVWQQTAALTTPQTLAAGQYMLSVGVSGYVDNQGSIWFWNTSLEGDDFIAFDAYDGQGWRQFGQSLDLSFELLAVPEPGVAGLVAGVMVLGMRRRAR